MAQHDYVVANQSGSSFRADLNNALSAIVSQNSGASEPSTTYAYQTWADTTAGVMKMRNGANSAWITLYQLDGEWSTIAFENGTAAAPSIYFKDSGTDTGFYSPGANQVGISTGGTSAVVVDASQRLLVGTSTARSNFFNQASTFAPQMQLEGVGSAGQAMLSITSGDSTFGPYLNLARQKSGAVGGNTAVSNNDVLGNITFQGSDGTEFVAGAEIAAAVDGTPGANDMPTRLVFSTTADGTGATTERMRINEAGRHFFFTSSDCLTAGTSVGAGTTNVIMNGVHSRTGTTTGGTTSINIFTNGNITNTNNSYAGISDVKLKENIIDANSQWHDIKALRVRKFNFKEDTGQQTHTQIGLVAQEVELVSPGLVYETPDRDEDGNETDEVTKGVNYSVLYMKAVKALQEAMERIEQLETKVAVLEAQ